ISAEICRLVDARLACGYRRIAAPLKRERRSDGLALVDMLQCRGRACHRRSPLSWPRGYPLGRYDDGVSGEMIRDMMVDCVEKRFGTIRAPHLVQGLSHKRSRSRWRTTSCRVSRRSKARGVREKP